MQKVHLKSFSSVWSAYGGDYTAHEADTTPQYFTVTLGNTTQQQKDQRKFHEVAIRNGRAGAVVSYYWAIGDRTVLKNGVASTWKGVVHSYDSFNGQIKIRAIDPTPDTRDFIEFYNDIGAYTNVDGRRCMNPSTERLKSYLSARDISKKYTMRILFGGV